MIPSVLGIIGAEDAGLRAGGRKENTWERKRKLTGATVRARDTNVPNSFDADNHVGRNGAPTSRIDREKWEPCLNCQDIEKLAKHIKCWPSYCPVSGRPLTGQAWSELEKRLRGECYV